MYYKAFDLSILSEIAVKEPGALPPSTRMKPLRFSTFRKTLFPSIQMCLMRGRAPKRRQKFSEN